MHKLTDFMPAVKELIKREFMVWPGDGLQGDLRLTTDAAADQTDAWIVAEARLGLRLAPLGRCNVLLRVARARGCTLARGRITDLESHRNLERVPEGRILGVNL